MLKVAVIILGVLFIYSILVALMVIIVPNTVLEGYFKSIAGDSLSSIQNAGYLQALTSLNRAVGLYGLTTSIASFFILMFAFRKSQKWAWWAMLVVGSIGWLWGLIDHITIGAKLGITIYSIGMIVFLVGIFLPVKAFFTKPVN